MRFVVASILSAFLVAMDATDASAADADPGPYPTWPWAVAQLLPSPALAGVNGEVVFAARWQVAPILYSFGTHRDVSRWRTFIVEPIVRHGGSVELHVGPEYFSLGSWEERFGVRAGVRAYQPILERGEVLSLSYGTAVLAWSGREGVAWETGLHTLLGMVGITTQYSPPPSPVRWMTSLQVRVF